MNACPGAMVLEPGSPHETPDVQTDKHPLTDRPDRRRSHRHPRLGASVAGAVRIGSQNRTGTRQAERRNYCDDAPCIAHGIPRFGGGDCMERYTLRPCMPSFSSDGNDVEPSFPGQGCRQPKRWYP